MVATIHKRLRVLGCDHFWPFSWKKMYNIINIIIYIYYRSHLDHKEEIVFTSKIYKLNICYGEMLLPTVAIGHNFDVTPKSCHMAI